MADSVLFEFLHTEMVAELWHPHPGPGRGGQKMSLSVLEGLGFRVGQALAKRLPRETLTFREELDVLKFLCRDLWVAVFQKQMDGLRTNHQGTYVLQDHSFPLLVPMASGSQYLEEAPEVSSKWLSRNPEGPLAPWTPASETAAPWHGYVACASLEAGVPVGRSREVSRVLQTRGSEGGVPGGKVAPYRQNGHRGT